ncbi:MAG: DUF1573 domain-containing protein [Planctomycetia bacterium]|nr:DUF1573 domain-containing protein [Planctomycetia bacterium]
MKVPIQMMNQRLKKVILFVVLFASILSVHSSLLGQQKNQWKWALDMFSEAGTDMVHDFGSVALHANVEHHFVFKNIYKEDVEIMDVRSSCGCTKVSANKKIVRSMETAEIIARIDTSGKEHTKQKKATITVYFSKPTYAEVQFQVRSYIRADVGFDQGSVEFGTVPMGESRVKKVYLQYEGRNDWALTAVKCSNPSIWAQGKEIKRQNGRVLYEITVKLKPEASAGYLNDLLRFTTNDQNKSTASVFLPVNGVVMEPLTIKPSYLQIGVLKIGDVVSKNLVVRSSTPFLIRKIVSTDSHLTFMVANQESTVHVVPITFSANQNIGYHDQSITIFTNLKDQGELTVPFNYFIIDQNRPQESLSETVNDGSTSQKTNDQPIIDRSEPIQVSRENSEQTKVDLLLNFNTNLIQEDQLEESASMAPVPLLQQELEAKNNRWEAVSMRPLTEMESLKNQETKTNTKNNILGENVIRLDSSRNFKSMEFVEKEKQANSRMKKDKPVFRNPRISLRNETEIKRF